MRAAALVALLAAATLLSACTEPAPAAADADASGAAETPDRQGRTSRDSGPEDNRTEITLGESSGGGIGPGRLGFKVHVPPGGATGVRWSVLVAPLASPTDTVEGPGCSQVAWWTGGLSSGFDGRCADLDEGETAFTLVLNEPVLGYDVTVTGLVPPTPATNATAPA